VGLGKVSKHEREEPDNMWKWSMMELHRGKIRLVDAKCRNLKKSTCKKTLRQVFICLRPLPLVGFCLGWCSNFVGSESGQKQSVELLQIMVSNNTTQHPPPPHVAILGPEMATSELKWMEFCPSKSSETERFGALSQSVKCV
jgi:hypothetical protein